MRLSGVTITDDILNSRQTPGQETADMCKIGIADPCSTYVTDLNTFKPWTPFLCVLQLHLRVGAILLVEDCVPSRQ